MIKHPVIKEMYMIVIKINKIKYKKAIKVFEMIIFI